MRRTRTLLHCVVLAALGCGGGEGRLDAAVDGEPDAYRLPWGTIYRNREPVACRDREQPPRWRAPDPGAAEGTVLFVASLGEDRFRPWTTEAGLDRITWPWMPPSLSGDGIATWFSYDPERAEMWGLGLSPEGEFANSGQFGVILTPRMWLPRYDALIGSHGGGGRTFFAPSPPEYVPQSSATTSVPAGIGEVFWSGGAFVTGGAEGDMPAWSPVTGDIVTFGFWPYRNRRGAGAGCSEGVRWFTQLPIDAGLSTAYVRPDGDVIIASQRETFVLEGATGQPLRRAEYGNEDGSPSPPAAYHPEPSTG